MLIVEGSIGVWLGLTHLRRPHQVLNTIKITYTLKQKNVYVWKELESRLKSDENTNKRFN